MPSSSADELVDQVSQMAAYETLREVANQLAGLLVARQLAADTDPEAEAWRGEHRALRARLDEIEPGTPAVAEMTQTWSRRLAALREGAA